MEDSTSVPVGNDGASSGGFFSNKRNLILLAAGIGGIAGLIILLSRRGSANAVANAAPTAAFNQTDLQLGNIATQLLQFRGESGQQVAGLQSSVDSATQAQQESASNILQQLGLANYNTSEGRAANARYFDILFRNLAELSSHEGVVLGANDLTQWYDYAAYLAATNTQKTASTVPLTSTPRRGIDELIANQTHAGAGGFSAMEFLPSVYDAGDGSADHWLALMSATPVRYIGR